jgi:hypothetical protein
MDEMLIHNVNTGYTLGLQTGFVIGVFVSAVFAIAALGMKRK